mmetsp:Transcript_31385/g.75851  ORF Transcript_31385/g.75851 Transcript_31385/m.75851 type:complete len:329 (-) Transcript_31385:126-1112(-)
MPSKQEVAAVKEGMRLMNSRDRDEFTDPSITRRRSRSAPASALQRDLRTISRAKRGLRKYVSWSVAAHDRGLHDIIDDEDSESVCAVGTLDGRDDDDESLSVCTADELGENSFDVIVLEEHEAPSSPNSVMDNPDRPSRPALEKQNSILQNIVEDFNPEKGDQKILRAVGRTAAVNAAVLVTALTGGAAGAVGYVAGGAITSKRLFDGLQQQDEKEVTKSLAVYGCATGASIAGQALTGALLIGVVGASLPVAGAVAFGVGCCSGITAGALSEWTVDGVMDKLKLMKMNGGMDRLLERCKSDGALLKSSGDRTHGMDESKRRSSCASF